MQLHKDYTKICILLENKCSYLEKQEINHMLTSNRLKNFVIIINCYHYYLQDNILFFVKIINFLEALVNAT